MNIDLCLCTFRRPHVAETLRSLATLELPADVRIKVIVADNDETPSAQPVVMKAAAETGLDVQYIHAPARNISVARNACLDAATAPLIVFLDDDELATPGWLKALLAEQERSKADIVLGPVQAIYAPDMPGWMREGDFHATLPVWVNGAIITGYTCNVLMDRAALNGLRFRPELGRSGGEDTAFFATLSKAGRRIAFAKDAVLTEAVTPERARFGWLLRRRFRSGQTHGLLLLETMGQSTGARLKAIAIAAAKAGFCALVALGNILRPVRLRFWLLRGAVHAGVISRLLGKRELEQYG